MLLIFTFHFNIYVSKSNCYSTLYKYIFTGLLIIFISSCNDNIKKSKSHLFSDIDPQVSGLDFVNLVKENAEFNIIKYLYFYNGGGVAIGDINNDGLEDVFLTSNQGQDHLYQNLGNLKFKKITVGAKINHSFGWSTGVNITDINGDGWKDIYICRVGQYLKFKNDYNKVYINNKNGTFTESSLELGLRFSGFSTQSAFFDMDRDGDLDLYLLNHSVKDASQFRPSNIRNTKDPLAGDILYENQDGVFVDISQKANIYQSSIGYGLGITISDFNNDGWQDIYICNDFHENDYLYINQKDKTFKEVCKESFGHTSNFSMGVDVDDIDDDGLVDLISVDMKPEDELTYKKSGGWENLQIYNFKRAYGYHHQQPKNSFQWNRGINENGIPIFSEISSAIGIDRTDWSWSPIITDFDQDGYKDIFITNGIEHRPNDLDFINFLGNNNTKINKDLDLIDKMPSGKQTNYFFKNKGQLKFDKVEWCSQIPTNSSGAAVSDLDNDGDQDLIINNFNSPVTLLENNLNHTSPTVIILKNNNKNTEALGSKLTIFAGTSQYHHQIKSVQGFQSSGSHKIILSNLSKIDSVKIIWPEGEIQIIKSIIIGKNNIIVKMDNLHKKMSNVNYNNSITELNFLSHKEDDFNDQTKDPWMPYLLSSLGPKVAFSQDEKIGYFTSSKNNNGTLWSLLENKKLPFPDKGIAKAATDENNAVFFDANGDKISDLYLCLGGNQTKTFNPLLSDILFLGTNDGNYKRDHKMLPMVGKNTSVAIPFDYDLDGDDDIFVGVLSNPDKFGKSENSYFLENINNKHFKLREFDISEMIFDAKIADLDKNGYNDIVLCGHWMPITILYNNKGEFSKQIIKDSEGLWFTLLIDDINNDGTKDIVAGNFGINHSIKCDVNHPLRLYIEDFDNNGQTESLLTYISNGNQYPFPNKDMFVSRLPSMKKKFLHNADFAGKPLNEIFSKSELNDCFIKECKTTYSTVFYNSIEKNKWTTEILPFESQLAPIRAIAKIQNNNTYIFGGNFYNVDPNIGRQDAMFPHVLKYSKGKLMKYEMKLPKVRKEITSISLIGNDLLFASNSENVIKFEIKK